MQERLKPYNKLRVYWSKKENDIMFYHPKHKPDGHLLHSFFDYLKFPDGKNLLEELESRGYDLTTLRFSIAYKEEEND